MADLDDIAQTKQFFRRRDWRTYLRPAYDRLYRAVEALDGEMLPPIDPPVPDRLPPRLPPAISFARVPVRRHTKRKRSPRDWSPKDDATLAKHLPDYDAVEKVLPTRSRSAILNRASRLCLSPHRKHWTAGEVSRLRKVYSWAPVEALIASFPGRSFKQLKRIASRYGLLRPRQPKPIGHPLFDYLRREASRQGYTMRKLDRLARSRTCFFGEPSGWQRINHGALGRAAEVLKVSVQLRWN
jgi:hypothetical protein